METTAIRLRRHLPHGYFAPGWTKMEIIGLLASQLCAIIYSMRDEMLGASNKRNKMRTNSTEVQNHIAETRSSYDHTNELILEMKNKPSIWLEGRTTYVVVRGSTTNQEWFLTNNSVEVDNPDPDDFRELYAMDLERTPESMLMAIGVICSKLWVDKGKFIEAMMPAINSVTWDRELMSERSKLRRIAGA